MTSFVKSAMDRLTGGSSAASSSAAAGTSSSSGHQQPLSSDDDDDGYTQRATNPTLHHTQPIQHQPQHQRDDDSGAEEDEALDDDSPYAAGLGFGSASHFALRGGGGGGGGGVGSLMTAEAVWSQKVVHTQVALEPTDDLDDDNLQ